jgi:CheY-like chemotaxis protein
MMKRILVVDDDRAILDLLTEALPSLGFEADFAVSGGNAIELLRNQRYDLILSDIRMPEVNGIEVAQVAMRSTPFTPILFMSGNPNVRVEEQSFLAKPFTISELEVKLSYMLDSATLED